MAKDLQAEALSKLDHRVKAAAEQFMKILEQIDTIVIYVFNVLHFITYTVFVRCNKKCFFLFFFIRAYQIILMTAK